MLSHLTLGRSGREAGAVIDTLIVIATIVLAVVFLAMPLRSRRSSRAPRINCVSNLKQAALAARMWSNDHCDLFPWKVPMSSNGVLEFATSGDVAAIFRSMSNELNTSKVLTCPADSTRKREPDFAKLRNKNISYFIGLDSNEAKLQTILFGDRNILGGLIGSNRVMTVTSTNRMLWGSDIHQNAGNVALSDGSAQQLSISGLKRQFQFHIDTSGATNSPRFAFP
jgi:hypothetical protein